MQRLALNPLYSLKDDINDKVFDNVEFDQESLELIAKGKDKDRYAVVGWHREESNNFPAKLVLHARPGLKSTATAKEIKQAAEYFGENKFVIARDQNASAGQGPGTGIVHTQLIRQIEQEIKLPSKKLGTIYVGLSFTLDEKKQLHWLNRSAQNLVTFKKDALAIAYLAFPYDLKSLKRYDLSKYSTEYHLNRSLPSSFFYRILKSLSQSHTHLTNIARQATCYTFRDEEAWEQYRQLPFEEIEELIKKALEKNIYFAACLDPSEHMLSKTQKEKKNANGYELTLKNILKVAEEYKILIDIHAIPEELEEKWSGETALMTAAKKGYIRHVELLLPYASEHHLEKKDILQETAFSKALMNGHLAIAELLAKKKPPSEEEIYIGLELLLEKEENFSLSLQAFKKYHLLMDENDINSIKESLLGKLDDYFSENHLDPIKKFQEELPQIFQELLLKTPCFSNIPLILRVFKKNNLDIVLFLITKDLLKDDNKILLNILKKRVFDIIKQEKYNNDIGNPDHKFMASLNEKTKIDIEKCRDIFHNSSLFHLTSKLQAYRLRVIDTLCIPEEKTLDHYNNVFNIFQQFDFFLLQLNTIGITENIKKLVLTTYEQAIERNDTSIQEIMEQCIKTIEKGISDCPAESLGTLSTTETSDEIVQMKIQLEALLCNTKKLLQSNINPSNEMAFNLKGSIL